MGLNSTKKKEENSSQRLNEKVFNSLDEFKPD